MEDIKFKIGTEEFLIKETFRALLLFEEMTGIKYKNDDKLGTQLKMMYCILKAVNRTTFKYSWDEFIDLLDRNQEAVENFIDYLKSIANPDDPDKKKVKKP
jgi:hypothetical protein